MAKLKKDDNFHGLRIQKQLAELRGEIEMYGFLIFYDPRMQIPNLKHSFHKDALKILRQHFAYTRPWIRLPQLMLDISLIDEAQKAIADEWTTIILEPEKKDTKEAQSVENGRAPVDAMSRLFTQLGLRWRTSPRFGRNSTGSINIWDIVVSNGEVELWIESKAQFTEGSADKKLLSDIMIVERIGADYFSNLDLLDISIY